MRFVILMMSVCIFVADIGYSAISVGISGANSTSSFDLETHKSTTLSGNVAVSILSFLRIGLTHRRSFERKHGLKKTYVSETELLYYGFEDNTEILTNSIDLTVILYQGVVSPFVFGGIARRDYFTEVSYPGSNSKQRTTLPAVPNYGFGVSIMLSRQFSLKISQTYTPGTQTELIGTEEVHKKVNDNYTQVGIGYQL